MDWHTLSIEETLKNLDVDPYQGLSEKEVVARKEKWGLNKLPEGEAHSILKVFLAQFKSPLIYLLFVAALAAFVMGEYSDGWVILFVVTINSVIGSFQEARAEKSMKDLQKVTTISVRVLREAKEKSIPAMELVPGDIVVFNAGDAIPADMRLLQAASLEASEAVLTGESVPVSKNLGAVEVKAALGDRLNMLYSGTFITSGRAKAVVVGTGVNTEIGKIAQLTSTVQEPPTPLSQRLAQFSQYLIYGALLVFGLIVIIGMIQGISTSEIVMIGISQVVSMVPEGLPVAMTIAAAVGVQRMAAKKTIVRKLSAVETLGSTSVICSDKTGTLTLNQMQVTEERPYPIPRDEERMRRLYQVAVLCNDAQVVGDKQLGDPTESALIAKASELGILKEHSDKAHPRVGEIPFDSVNKMMATEHDGNGEHFVALKGAPDSLLELCTLSEDEKVKIREWNEEMARGALRVLAFGWIPHGRITGNFEDLKGKVDFLGLLGQMDPPREEVKLAIADCRRAGIRPVMITGDHKTTGFAIAKMIGLAQEGDRAVDGKELDENLSDINNIAVFARVHPSQKLKLVDAFQKQGHVVAMTGDGVNDAPALGKADVGVAMGITGTEVAKEASKIIVTDDNFATIVSAIAEGRLVYQNIKKILLFQFSISLAEISVLLVSLILGFPPPYVAVQILWNNLVTEGVININLIMDPPEGTEMDRDPINKDEPILTRLMMKRLLFMVPTILLCTFGWFAWRMNQGIDLALARTETLTMLVVCEWFNVLNCRSETKSALNWSILKNKWLLGGLIIGNVLHIIIVFWRPLGKYFHTVPIDLAIIPWLVLIGSTVLWVEEIRKFFIRGRSRRLPA